MELNASKVCTSVVFSLGIATSGVVCNFSGVARASDKNIHNFTATSKFSAKVHKHELSITQRKLQRFTQRNTSFSK